VADKISSGRLTTEYRYRHGYWDGVEREFRGFAMVEQRDTETFHDGDRHYSPPTLTRSWFHVGPVAAAEAGDWAELDLSHEYWPGDPSGWPVQQRSTTCCAACRAPPAGTPCDRYAGRCCAPSCTRWTAATGRTAPTR
jgi:hypothetical protein